MPFDGVRTAVAAGGGTLKCYGMANSVECYMDGAFLKVDWLIMDLEGEFEFLLGWDAMHHYKMYPVHNTGQMRGTDYNGVKFMEKR